MRRQTLLYNNKGNDTSRRPEPTRPSDVQFASQLLEVFLCACVQCWLLCGVNPPSALLSPNAAPRRKKAAYSLSFFYTQQPHVLRDYCDHCRASLLACGRTSLRLPLSSVKKCWLCLSEVCYGLVVRKSGLAPILCSSG